MKKIISSLFVVLLFTMITSTVFAEDSPNNNDEFSFTLDLSSVELKKGEITSIPLTLYPTNPDNESTIQPLMAFPGNAGVVNLWDSGGRLYYSVVLNRAATSFSGTLSITNLTTGLSMGRNNVSSFAGSFSYGASFNHRYSASLDGKAYLLGVPVASTTFNYFT